MHTQNVKTAAPESSERWVKNTSSIVAEQGALLGELSGLYIYEVTTGEDEMVEILRRYLVPLALNVAETTGAGKDGKPCVFFPVAQGWMLAKRVVESRYSLLGLRAWERVRAEIFGH